MGKSDGEKSGKWTLGTQTGVARWFAVSKKTIEAWRERGCPGDPTGYDVQQMCRWVVRQRKVPVVEDGRGGKAAPVQLSASGSQSLESLRSIKTEIAKLELAERLRRVVDVQLMDDFLEELVNQLRTISHRLSVQFGNDVAELYEEAMDEIDARLAKFLKEYKERR